MKIDFAGVYDVQQIRQAETTLARAYRKEAPSANYGCLFLSFLMTLALVVGASSQGSYSGASQWAVLGGCVTAFFLWQVISARRRAGGHPLVGLNAFGSVDKERISFTLGDSQLDEPWASFSACRVTNKEIVLFPGKQEYLLLPSSFFASPEDFSNASAMCKGAIRRRSPLPLVNWRSIGIATIILLLVVILMIISSR